jgi:hypothetical protein
MKDIIATFKSQPHNLMPAATEEEISHFEQVMDIQLPEDFKMLYRYTNGTDYDENMFRFMSLADMIDRGRDDANLNEDQDFHFAEYLVYCDIWTLSLENTGYNIYKKNESLTLLFTDSLAVFLDKYLSGGLWDGLYNWEHELSI